MWEIYLPFLTEAIYHTITENIFPEQIKKQDVIPLCKKGDPLKKESYRPVSLLPHVLQVFERIIYKQINTYLHGKLSKHITRFQKSHGTQRPLNTILEKWKSTLDKGRIFVLFMDLPNVFDTINNDLLGALPLAMLQSYAFSINSLDLMCIDVQLLKKPKTFCTNE